MKKILVVMLALCFLASPGFAADRSKTPIPVKEYKAPTTKVPLAPSSSRPTSEPKRPAKPKPTFKPMTVTLPPQPPIIDSFSFDGLAPNGNLKWKAWIKNPNQTTYPSGLALGVSAGPNPLWKSVGGGLVGPLTPGQRKQLTGSFIREYIMTKLRVRLQSSTKLLQEMQVQLPPDVTYKASIVSISRSSVNNNVLEIRVRNTGTTGIPIVKVYKECAHSSAPNSFTNCNWTILKNIPLGQTVVHGVSMPPGWPDNPNTVKVKVRRGGELLDEKLYSPPAIIQIPASRMGGQN